MTYQAKILKLEDYRPKSKLFSNMNSFLIVIKLIKKFRKMMKAKNIKKTADKISLEDYFGKVTRALKKK